MHLCNELDPAGDLTPSHPRRATYRRIVLADLSKAEHRILRAVQEAHPGRLTAPELRDQFAWAIPARMADTMIARLVEQNYITIVPDGSIQLNPAVEC